MANTKVTGDLIANSTVTATNLADSAVTTDKLANSSVTAAKLNSITTDNISEGTNLFYTDARVGTYLSGNGYDTATNIIATITDSAPTTLDTLNELAAALGDDPNFATTVTNSIATKLPLAGGTLTGDLIVNTNVGIGTISPNAKLHVFEDQGTTAIFQTTTAGEDAYVELSAKDNAGVIRQGFVFYNPDSNTVGFRNGNANILHVDNAGRVGINTSSPTVPLEVNGGAENTVAKFVSTDANAHIEFADNATGQLIKIGSQGNDFRIQTNDTERLRIDSNGNVGIGTATPLRPLDVIGSVGTAVATFATETGGGTNRGIRIVPETFGATIGAVGINTELAFNTSDAGSSKERLRIDSDGRIGIGTSAPDVNIHLLKSGDIAFRLESSTADAITLQFGSTAETAYGRLRYDSGSHDMRFYTNNSEKMRIDSAGNVGIGTSSPAQMLELSSNNEGGTALNVLRFSDKDVGAAANQPSGRIEFYTSDTNNVGIGSAIEGVAGTGGTGSAKLLFEVGGSERMRITSDGRVGIGTDSPNELLHIFNGSGDANFEIESTATGGDARLMLKANSSGVSQIRFEDEADANVGLLTYDHSDNSMQFRTNDAERMRIASGGNIGIGKSSPRTIFNIEDTYGEFLINDFGHILTRNKNYAQANEFWAISPRNSGDIDIGLGTLETNNSIDVSNAFFTINPTGVVMINTTSTTGAPSGTKLIVESNNDAGQGGIYIRGDGGAGDFPFVVSDRDNNDEFIIYGDGDVENATGVYGQISSDIRLKENINPATPKLGDILNLNVVNYNYIGNDKKQLGFIAQEFEQIFPSLVKTRDTRKYDSNGNLISGYENGKSLRVGMEFAILTKAIQELKEIIDNQQQQINDLKAQLNG